MSEPFPVLAEHKYLYGEFDCAYCYDNLSGFHHVVKLNLSKPDAGTGEDDMVREENIFEVLEVCETCWDSEFGPVQHWYEHEYLDGETHDEFPEELKVNG